MDGINLHFATAVLSLHVVGNHDAVPPRLDVDADYESDATASESDAGSDVDREEL